MVAADVVPGRVRRTTGCKCRRLGAAPPCRRPRLAPTAAAPPPARHQRGHVASLCGQPPPAQSGRRDPPVRRDSRLAHTSTGGSGTARGRQCTSGAPPPPTDRNQRVNEKPTRRRRNSKTCTGLFREDDDGHFRPGRLRSGSIWFWAGSLWSHWVPQRAVGVPRKTVALPVPSLADSSTAHNLMQRAPEKSSTDLQTGKDRRTDGQTGRQIAATGRLGPGARPHLMFTIGGGGAGERKTSGEERLVCASVSVLWTKRKRTPPRLHI